jgi:hypothetical protein
MTGYSLTGDILVACPGHMCCGFRRAAPEAQGATTGDTGLYPREAQRRASGCPARKTLYI